MIFEMLYLPFFLSTISFPDEFLNYRRLADVETDK
jgi:hypothetical protein